jgi:uncharacterized protein (TIGR00255 family)
MIISMTGFGKAEAVFNGKKYMIEARSVNSRYLELFFKFPKKFASKELDLKEQVKNKISRGKINISLTAENDGDENTNLNLDEKVVSDYYELLNKIREKIGSEESIRIDHILKFTDLFSYEEPLELERDEFDFTRELLDKGLDDLISMKKKEGKMLEKDMLQRIKFIDQESNEIKKISDKRVHTERKRLMEKIELYLKDKSLIDENRLEMELALMVERIDIAEEIIRLKSHTKYFKEYTRSPEFAGRRLNFLTQEINREINTIASKSTDAEISQKVTVMKEELEKIREQLQNVE